MISPASTPEQYINGLPADRRVAFTQLRNTILAHIPAGFEETMSYGMIGYVVPFKIYPQGYHCDTALPLPFVSIASQKNFIALYHMGIYAIPKIHQWFVEEYPKHNKTKLDMGKSCIRFKKPDQVPYELIGTLMQKITVLEWISVYEKNIKRNAE